MAEASDPPRRSKRSKRDDPKIIGSWKLGKTIGKGSSGRVKIARHISTGEYAAVKIVSKQALITSRMSMSGMTEQADKILLSIEREIVLMKLIDHPNVLSLYDVWETSNELYLILEYVQNGELFDHLVSKGRLSMQEALVYFQQIISAVDYCHRFKIAHRDLKPENLLLDRDNNIKVADFGMAAWEGGMDMLETSCGSPHYASPEVVQGKAYKGFTSDIWSCGVILYALLVGRLPFDDENIRHLLDKVKRGKFVMPTDIPFAAQDLIARMLEKDVNKRITMQQILRHPWFTCLPPKPLRSPVVSPPSLEVVHRPVESVNEIDPDIFANLRTLWHGAPDDQIISSLLNDESTWEKAVYTLLIQYRVRRLEDYGGAEDQATPHIDQKPPPIEQKPVPTEPIQPLLSPTAWNDTQITLKIEVDAVQPTPLRLGHPTPAGPRTPPSKTVALASSSTSQSPQPIRLVQDSSNKASTSTQGSGHDSPKLPPIVMSELGGQSMQQFFSQVADHVNSNRPPITAGQPRSEIPTIREPPGGGTEDDGRFADADEDSSSIGDNASIPCSIVTSRTTATQSTGESSPGIPGFGLGISTQSSQHRRYTIHVPMPTNALPAIFTSRIGPVPHLHGQPGRAHVRRSEVPPNSLLPPPVSRPAPEAMDRIGATSSDKENVRPTGTVRRPRAGTTYTKPPTGPNMGVYLERRRTLGDRRVQIVLPGEENKFSQKYSQSSTAVSENPISVEDLYSFPVVSNDSDASSRSSRSPWTEKPTWFGNLFKFKPATFHLLSVYDVVSSRDACKRLLTAMGVSVILEISGNLSCRFDGATDPSGVMDGVKAVRFRVELHGVLHSHAVAGFTSSISMIQEKGALSSFKLLYNRLRREWDLDAPTPILKTPKTSLSAVMSSQRRSYDL